MQMLMFFLASPVTPGWVIPVIIAVAVVCLAGGGAIGALVYRKRRNDKVGTTQVEIDTARKEAADIRQCVGNCSRRCAES